MLFKSGTALEVIRVDDVVLIVNDELLEIDELILLGR